MATPSGGRPATGLPWTRSLPLLTSVRPAIAAQQRGLAAAGGTHHAHDFVALDGERELMEGDDGSLEKKFAHPLRNNGGFVCCI